jgi:hypothetical protein
MKTYYILANISPNGVSIEHDCGLMVEAESTQDAFIKFEEHYSLEWGVGISYNVIDFCLIEELVRL